MRSWGDPKKSEKMQSTTCKNKKNEKTCFLLLLLLEINNIFTGWPLLANYYYVYSIDILYILYMLCEMCGKP